MCVVFSVSLCVRELSAGVGGGGGGGAVLQAAPINCGFISVLPLPHEGH